MNVYKKKPCEASKCFYSYCLNEAMSKETSVPFHKVEKKRETGEEKVMCPDCPSSFFAPPPSMLHSMASGIQIAIKGLSVSS